MEHRVRTIVGPGAGIVRERGGGRKLFFVVHPQKIAVAVVGLARKLRHLTGANLMRNLGDPARGTVLNHHGELRHRHDLRINEVQKEVPGAVGRRQIGVPREENGA